MKQLVRNIFIFAMLVMSINVSATSPIKGKYLVFFYTDNCQYCREMKLFLEKINTSMGVKIVGNTLDTLMDGPFVQNLQSLELFREFKVSTYPTLIAVDMDKKDFKLISVGMLDEEFLIENIREFYGIA